MKIKKSIFALVLVVAIMAGFAAGATASSTQKQITAVLDYGASVKLNGVQQNLLDQNGNRIYLINYGGSTYLPVRALAEQIFNLKVDWDQATHTVLLNQPTGVKLIDDIKPYYVSPKNTNSDAYAFYHTTSEEKTWTISGFDVTNYVDLYVRGNDWSSCRIGQKSRASFNLGSKYESVTFKCYCPQDAILRVYADNEALQKEIHVRGSAVAQEYTVPVFGSAELTFEVEKTTNGANTDMYIFDARVTPIPIGQ